MHVVSLSGSPSPQSRSAWLLDWTQRQLTEHARGVRTLSLRELPAHALLQANTRDAAVRDALDSVARADVVLVGTPIYKAAYSGLLKSFLDLLPQDALRDKTVLPLATGGSTAHLLAIDYALQPVLHSLGARRLLDGVFVTEAQMPAHETLGYAPEAGVFERIERALAPLRRRVLPIVASAAIGLVASTSAVAQTARHTLRIGYQKYGTLTLLKARSDLEKRLAPAGVDVKWTEFPAGPQLLEGLNVGSIDFGTVGEAPPVFAQAAGADIVYVANQPPAPQAEAIIVAKDSPLKSVAELRGKKVALNKGSNVHYLLLRALENAGLKYGDVQTVFLPPADARAAFERGAVDAWVIWDPFFAAAQKQLGARVLADGRNLVSNHQFYLASRSYAARQPQVLQAIVSELARLDAWAEKNPNEVASFLAPQIGLDVAVAEVASRRFAYGIQPITPAVAAEQQKIADAFVALKLIPKPIRIVDALPATAITQQAAR